MSTTGAPADSDDEEIIVPAVPTAPPLPDPPQVAYQRPQPKIDPTEAFLARRGLGGSDAGNMGKAFGVGTGLVGSILAGTGLGWMVDKYLLHSTTTPWGLIVGFFLGVLSGFIKLMQLSKELSGK